jgi:lipopolysaccharide heptosyltransferase II
VMGDGDTGRRGHGDTGRRGRGDSVSLHARVRSVALRLIGRLYLGAKSSPSAPRSILLIRPDHLGDMLFLTPALHALRSALPEARITLLAGPWGAEVVRNNPDLDAVEICVFPGFERQPKGPPFAPYRLLAATARRLRTGVYDAAVVLRFDHWWGAWLVAAAGIPQRIGYAMQPFLTQALPYRPDRHEVTQNATLLAALAPGLDAAPGPTRYTVTATDRAWAADWLTAQGVGPVQRLVAVHPGAGAVVKQWPIAAWAEVANRLVEHLGVQILLTGGPSEQGLTAALTQALPQPVFDAAGATTLGQLAALYARCALVLGSDSGPLHLAVAVGTPTVHLYGPVPPAKFGPWASPVRHVVLQTNWACAPCARLDWPAEVLVQHACMVAIRPDDVIQAAHALLG